MLKITLLSMLVCSLCCGKLFAQADKVDSSKMMTLRIDPEASRGAAVSQVFDEVEFIPLETTKESLFGSISKLEVTADHYIIFDYDTRSVLIFFKDGKYKTKIEGSKMEKDPNPGARTNTQIFGFELVNENDKQLIQFYLGRYFLYYDLNGKLVKRVLGKDLPYGSQRKFSDGTTIDNYYLDSTAKDSTRYDIALIKDKKAVAKYFPFPKNRYDGDQFYSSGDNLTQSGSPDEYFYETFYVNNIYRIRPKGVSLDYKIVFPAAMSLPKDFLSNPNYKGKRQEYFEKNNLAIYGVGNVYQIGDNLYFKTVSWSWTKDRKNALIYNVKTAALTSITNLEPDSLSQHLPVTDAGYFYDFLNQGFNKYDGTHFYTSYSSLAMFSFKELNEGKNRKYNATLENYFKTSNKKSNPIIVKLKPKKV